MGVIALFICTGITPSIAVDTVKKPSMPNSTGKILYVGGSGEGNYTKIQAAIWAANDGDTVFVYKGTYNECLEIEKTINLIGQNKHTTIIDGKNIPNPTAVVYLRDCNKVLLTGFTIQNGVGYSTYQAGITTSRATNYNTITGNIIADNRDGLKIYGDYHLISENIIRGNKDDGIHLTDSFNNTIINNTFESGDGIYILCLFGNLYQSWGSHNIENNIADGKPIYYYNNENGIVVSNDASQVILANCNNCIVENLSVSNMDNGILIGGYSSNNHIRSNSITDSKYGIDIECCAYYNYIYNNIIINTDYGVDIDYTPYNNISNNIITNSVYGITLWDTESNTIYGNTIEDNTIGIYSTPHSIPVKGVSYLSFRHRENEIYRNTFTNNDVGIYQFYWGGDDIYENKIINNRIGIYMDSMYGWGGYNNVFNNSIMENQVGIDIIGGFGGGPTNNNIYRNNIINNRIGIRIWHALFDEGTNDNKIYQNNFIGNRWFHARDNCISHYDENYWDNWIGFKIKLPIFQRFPKIITGFFKYNFDIHPANEPYDIGTAQGCDIVMRTSCVKNNGLVAGVILLFIGVALSPGITAVDNDTETGDEPIDNSGIEPLNNNVKEIFSKIDGSCLGSSFHGIGVFFNAEIRAGYSTWIQIIGISLFRPRIYTINPATYVKAPIFIGYTLDSAPGAQTVHGIAIGDIEWS